MKAGLAMAAAALVTAMAADAPPSAATLLDHAKAEAARDHRAIWVIFHASW